MSCASPEFAGRRTLWLDANENPYGWPRHLLAQAWDSFRTQGPQRYPRSAGELTRALGEYAGVPADWVLPANGSDELIVALLSSLGRQVGRVVMPWPTFTFYRRVAAALGLAVVTVSLGEDFSLHPRDLLTALAGGDAALVVLCRPNNPTGNLFPREAVLEALEAGAWVVADEAYYEFSGETVADLLGRHPRLLVFRTLSKAFALAGLRVGYALGHPQALACLRSVMQPYSVDSFSLAAARVALEHRALMAGWVKAICRERERLTRRLRALAGVRPWPSLANFVLVQVLPESGWPAEAVVGALAERGVRVRYWPDEPRLRDYLRVTVGRPGENRTFVRCLAEVLAGGRGDAAREGSRGVTRGEAIAAGERREGAGAGEAYPGDTGPGPG